MDNLSFNWVCFSKIFPQLAGHWSNLMITGSFPSLQRAFPNTQTIIFLIIGHLQLRVLRFHTQLSARQEGWRPLLLMLSAVLLSAASAWPPSPLLG